MKAIGFMLLVIAVAGTATAANVSVPEIDPASAVGSIALLSGALLIIRGRQKRS